VSPPRDVEIVREVKRSRGLFCLFCRKKGATINCTFESCTKNYHLHCGLAYFCSVQYNNSSSYCPAHRNTKQNSSNIRDHQGEAAFASGAAGSHSATIAYLVKELTLEVLPVSTNIVNLVLDQQTDGGMNQPPVSKMDHTPQSSPMKNFLEIAPSDDPTTPTKVGHTISPKTLLSCPEEQEVTITVPQCSPFWKEYAGTSVLVKVQNSKSSSDGPLSDIDDILKGNVSGIETHPMASFVFSPDNPNLENVLDRLNNPQPIEEEEEMDVEIKEKVKKKRKKKSDMKLSTSPRKSVLMKQHNQRLKSEDTPETKSKPKKKFRVEKLPLSARQIYHGRNWTPMSKFGTGESEAECDCSWVMNYTKNRLDDLVDVNGGEKVLMDMLNKHVNKYQGRGVLHLDLVLKEFITEHSHIIVAQNLYRNFMCHVANLHQASLVTGETVLAVTNSLQEVMRVMPETQTVIGLVLMQQRDIALAARRAECASPTRKPKSASRSRVNSHMAGIGGCRSPSRVPITSPKRTTLPSSPAVLSSPSKIIPRSPLMSANGPKRMSNLCINVQKLSPASPTVKKLLNFDSSLKELNSTNPNINQTAKKLSTSDVRSSDSESESFHSTLGESEFNTATAEVQSTPKKLSSSNHNVNAILPPMPADILPLSFDFSNILVLTDEPDSESESEMFLSPCTSPPPEELDEESTPGPQVDYLNLQEVEYEKIRRVARQGEDRFKVLVFYVDDKMIEKIRPVSQIRASINSKTRRKRENCSKSSTPDLEVSFPGLVDKKKKTGLEIWQTGVDSSCLVEQLERTEEVVKKVKDDIMRQTTPTYNLN